MVSPATPLSQVVRGEQSIHFGPREIPNQSLVGPLDWNGSGANFSKSQVG
jgi:hypothetical protein